MTQREFEIPEALTRLQERHEEHYKRVGFHRFSGVLLPDGHTEGTTELVNLIEPSWVRSKNPADKETIDGVIPKVHRIAEWVMTSEQAQSLINSAYAYPSTDEEIKKQSEDLKSEERRKELEQDRWFENQPFEVLAYSQHDEQGPNKVNRLILNVDIPEIKHGLSMEFYANRTFNLSFYGIVDASDSLDNPDDNIQAYTSSDVPLEDMRDEEAEIINFYLDKFIRLNLVS
ncbi:hypothetical protein HYS92_00990 [Candidatus Daviesbacteria bacterium]|nr:hypothetical protein [Candidatus Daviesbacteria bacterium]